MAQEIEHIPSAHLQSVAMLPDFKLDHKTLVIKTSWQKEEKGTQLSGIKSRALQ